VLHVSHPHAPKEALKRGRKDRGATKGKGAPDAKTHMHARALSLRALRARVTGALMGSKGVHACALGRIAGGLAGNGPSLLAQSKHATQPKAAAQCAPSCSDPPCCNTGMHTHTQHCHLPGVTKNDGKGAKKGKAQWPNG